jgi:hypothetical protein
MSLRVPNDDWAAGGYDRAAAVERRKRLAGRLAAQPGPTIAELLTREPEDDSPSAEDIDAMIRAIYDAREQDLARRTDDR